MKRILTSALILALTIGAAQAQNTQTPKHPGHPKERMAFNDLNLSNDQKARLKSIQEDFKKQMDDLNKQDKITVAEMKQRKEALQQKFKTQSEAVLTPAQKEQLAKKQADIKEFHKGDRGHYRGEGHMEGGKGGHFGKGKLPEELNLTADQKQRIAQIHSEYRPRFDALRSDSSLTQEQRKSKMMELKKQKHDQVKLVLTAEQAQKLENLRQQKASKNL